MTSPVVAPEGVRNFGSSDVRAQTSPGYSARLSLPPTDAGLFCADDREVPGTGPILRPDACDDGKGRTPVTRVQRHGTACHAAPHRDVRWQRPLCQTLG